MGSEKITLRNVVFNIIFSPQEDLKLAGQVLGSMFFKDELVLKFEGVGRKGMFDSITLINTDLEADMIDHLNSKGFNEKLLDVETFVVEAFFIFESRGIIKSYAKCILDEHLENQKEHAYVLSYDNISDSFGVFVFETNSNLETLIQNKKDVTKVTADKFYEINPIKEPFKSLYYVYYNDLNELIMEDLTK